MLLRIIAVVIGGSALLSIISYGGHLAFDSSASPRFEVSVPARPTLYFAPNRNLEAVDIPLIASARRSVDVAMYTFTDRRIAEALVDAGRSGVQIRIYRDREQFENEERRGGQVMEVIAHHPNLHVRVKASRDLMHEKAFVVDGRILRDGSSNWSVSAARYQDNEITVTTASSEVSAFDANFAEMWSRPGNKVIQ